MVGWVGHCWRWCFVYVMDIAKRVSRMSGDAGALPECEVKTLMRPDQWWVGWGMVGGGVLYACWTYPRGLVACREMPEHFLSVR